MQILYALLWVSEAPDVTTINVINVMYKITTNYLYPAGDKKIANFR